MIKHQDIQDFDDYAKLSRGLIYSSIGGGVFSGPGFAQVFTCAASPAAATATTRDPLPSVGMYLDEQPITTIQGSLDINIYDVARIEALAGPQGTLYGASSEAGTVRIITNKPDPSGFRRRLFGRGQVTGRRHRPRGQGFVNAPMSPAAGDPPGRHRRNAMPATSTTSTAPAFPDLGRDPGQ